MAIDQPTLDMLTQWIGRTETLNDAVTQVPVMAMSAALDRDDPHPHPGDDLPPLWHWLYFLPLARQSGIGADGHPKRGGFLPPVPLPRRMWAGSRITWHAPLQLGQAIHRTSKIDSVTHKSGRSGDLVFVQVRHEVFHADTLAIVEEQDIVYRDAARPGDPAPAPASAPADAQWTRTIVPDPVLLFRYSALTFNGHRIHYDRPYAMNEEGYAGLVVHGPLTATLLADLARRSLPGARLAKFAFRGVRPILDTAPFEVCGKLEADGKTVQLWARDAEGWLCMQANAELA